MKYYKLTKTGEFTPLSKVQFDIEREDQILAFGNCFAALLIINGEDAVVLCSTEFMRFCHTQNFS